MPVKRDAIGVTAMFMEVLLPSKTNMAKQSFRYAKSATQLSGKQLEGANS